MAVFSLLMAVSVGMKIVAVLFVITAVVLVLAVLVQKGRGGGLSGAFGGAMASGILGSKTGDFLTWVTIGLVALFLTLAVVLARYYRPTLSDYGGGPTIRQRQPIEEPGSGTPGRDSNAVGGGELPGLR